MLKILRFFFALVLVVGLAAAGSIGFSVYRDKSTKYEVPPDDVEVPSFSRIEVDFLHRYVPSRGLPYTAGAIIDVDNDGVDELFIGGGERQSDGLFVFLGEKFVNVADQAGLVKLGSGLTLGASVIDFDNNGYQDLVVSREHGVWLYANYSGKFTMSKLDIEIPADGAPLAAAIVDLNRDGAFDFFLPMVQRTSRFEWLSGKRPDQAVNRVHPRLYINNGDNRFYDFTNGAGLQDIDEALQAIFVDLDDDTQEDLVVLQSGGTLTLWNNIGNLLFENKPHYYAGLNGDYMGLGTGDYDGDGKIDFLLTNRGTTLAPSLLNIIGHDRADFYSKWVLMNSGGYFTFRKDAHRAELADYELGRGALFTDLNSDGREDLLVAQNHPYWPLYMVEAFRLSGHVFLQNSKKIFTEASAQTNIKNTGFGVTPLQTDFNKDGKPDIVHLNLGGKSLVFLSKEGKNHYLNVELADTAHSLGAHVEVKTLSGKTLKKTYLVGRELCSDSSHTMFFGLGQDKATDVVVEYTSGKVDQTSGVLYNTMVTFD